MAKMISLQSIAVAATGAGLPSSDEGKLFRFALRHSLLLTVLVGLDYDVPGVRRAAMGAVE